MTEHRQALGRGLASLLPDKPIAAPISSSVSIPTTTAHGVMEVPIEKLVQNPNQPRKNFDEESLKELAASISEKGVLQPILVYQKGDRYHVVAGERRFRAAKMAGQKTVPVLVKDVAPSDFLELALIENIQREDLNPIEEAEGYQELMRRFQYTQDQVAQRVGKERSTVANSLRLLKLPTKIKQAIIDNTLSMGHARALAGVEEMERQLYLADKAIQEAWSVRQLEERVSLKSRVPKRQRTPEAPSPQIASLMDQLKKAYGTQVQIVTKGKGGRIVIDFYSWEDLDRIYRKMLA